MNIKTFIKRNAVIYRMYFYLMSFLVNLYKRFLTCDDKLILFVCYGGRHYSDSTRVIYEAMLKDGRFSDYNIVWAFTSPDKYPFIPNRIQIDTVAYYRTALKARCWVTNVIVERALDFTGIKTYYFHTTHGVLCKLDGLDAKDSKNFKSLAKCHFDCCTVQSAYERDVYAGMMGIDKNLVKIVGVAKNDILVHHTRDYRQKLRERLGIPNNKKAVLYAPTFREEDNFMERFDVDVELWRKYLAEDYVLLYRAHPIVSTNRKANDDFFKDVTAYEMVEDIMIASDVLVSDYSGIIFDYCLMDKPIFLWTYDYDSYQRIRGLYFDIRKELPYAEREEDLLRLIMTSGDKEVVDDYVCPFRRKYATEYGHATENALDLIYNNIQSSIQ